MTVTVLKMLQRGSLHNQSSGLEALGVLMLRTTFRQSWFRHVLKVDLY